MTIYGYIISDQDPMDIFGKYCGIRGNGLSLWSERGQDRGSTWVKRKSCYKCHFWGKYHIRVW